MRNNRLSQSYCSIQWAKVDSYRIVGLIRCATMGKDSLHCHPPLTFLMPLCQTMVITSSQLDCDRPCAFYSRAAGYRTGNLMKQPVITGGQNALQRLIARPASRF